MFLVLSWTRAGNNIVNVAHKIQALRLPCPFDGLKFRRLCNRLCLTRSHQLSTKEPPVFQQSTCNPSYVNRPIWCSDPCGEDECDWTAAGGRRVVWQLQARYAACAQEVPLLYDEYEARLTLEAGSDVTQEVLLPPPDTRASSSHWPSSAIA